MLDSFLDKFHLLWPEKPVVWNETRILRFDNEIKSTGEKMEKRIIYLGNQETYPPKSYTFAELAAEQERMNSGNHCVMKPYPKWEEVAKNTTGNDVGIIAYENATVGILKDNEELIEKYRLLRTKTIIVPVILCAGTYPGNNAYDAVYSYKDALGQCTKYIRAVNLCGKEVSTDSTSAGVSLAKERRTGIAIARKEALLDGGLEIIAEDIGDKRPNFTKFYVVRKN